MQDLYPQEYAKAIRTFFTEEGRLKSIPAQRKKKLFIFEHILAGLDPEREYAEAELNDYIRQFHDDPCTIRREFILNQQMIREQSVYKLNSRDKWARV